MLNPNKPALKKLFLIFSFLILVTLSFGQDSFIQGRIINSENYKAVTSVKVIRMDSLFDVSSDKNGFFKIQVPPKGKTSLLFSHPDFILQTLEITPEFTKTPILIKLVPTETTQAVSPLNNYKNTLAFAPVELLFLGLTFEYERRITPVHAVGSYATAFLNQGFWMVSSDTRLRGVKLEPFYRYYVRSGNRDIGFGQVKLVYANFIIDRENYNGNTSKPAQAYGVGLAWGWKILHSLLPRHSIEIVLGAKFVPFITEDENINQLIKNYRRGYWWNIIGPGAFFDVKFTLGGIF